MTHKQLRQLSKVILKSKLRFSTIETGEAIFVHFPEKKSLSQQNLLNTDLPVFTTFQSLQLIKNFLNFFNPITTGGEAGAETARNIKMLYAAQKLLTRIFSNSITFPNFYSSKSWCNF